MITIDKFVKIATTSTSVSISVTGLRLPVFSVSTGIACGLALIDKVFHETSTNKKTESQTYNERAQQKINFFNQMEKNCRIM